MRTKRITGIALAGLTLAALTACGGGNDTTPQVSDIPAVTVPSEQPTPTAPATPTPDPGPNVSSFDLTVAPGDLFIVDTPQEVMDFYMDGGTADQIKFTETTEGAVRQPTSSEIPTDIDMSKIQKVGDGSGMFWIADSPGSGKVVQTWTLPGEAEQSSRTVNVQVQ